MTLGFTELVSVETVPSWNVRASLFGDRPEECLEQVSRLKEFVTELAWW